MDLEQISYRKVNKTVPFGHIISESGLNRLRSNLENGGIIISANNTDLSDNELELEIKNSSYSYSRVYGVNDSYKPSFIVYCKDRNGEFIKCCWSGIDERKMEQIVAGMKEEESDSEFKMYSWDGELLASVLPIMLEKGAFKEVNWNWDNKIKKEKQILKKIGI